MAGWRAESLMEYLDRIPPPACILVARQHGRPMTYAQVAKAAGMTMQRVVYIARQDTFDRVPGGDIDRYRMACGITMSNAWKTLQYLRRTFDEHLTARGLHHLRKLPLRKQKRLLRLCREWCDERTE